MSQDIATAITLLLTTLLVVVTAFYAYVTRRIMRANEATLAEIRQQTWETSRAYVSARLSFRYGLCMLELSNEGRTPARFVRLKLDRELVMMGDGKTRVDQLPLFSQTMDTFPPGYRYFIPLWGGTDKPGEGPVPSQFVVNAAYETLGRSVAEDIVLDFGLYEGGLVFPPEKVEDSAQELVSGLRNIQKTIDDLKYRLEMLLRNRQGQT